MLLFVVLFPQSRYNSTVFAVTLAWMWGAVASFVFPDRSGYTQPFELANYYLQHISICGAPILYLFTRRSAGLAQLSLRENLMISSFGNCLHCFYHLFLLWPLASGTNINLNYMLSPPSGIPSVISQSPHYRFIIMVATFLLAGPATGVLLPRLVHALPPIPFLSYETAAPALSADSKQRGEDGGSDKKQ
jgi:hypothetical protein